MPSESHPQHQRVVRRLAAVLAADVVGYSRLMGSDEEGTLARLNALRREVIDPAFAQHGGRIFKTMGDGLLVEFASAVDAVVCAAALQTALSERHRGQPAEDSIVLRIGINSGDVIVEGDDLHGDGVNVAARLEPLAEPGGICISGEVYGQVRGKVPFEFVAMGAQRLKNIAHEVMAYRLAPANVGAAARASVALGLPDKPSIAVLPFQNMSGDPEQEYFADGMVDEIITALSRVKSFFVIARNSSFTYKGRAVDVKHVARELGVRYVLEGSVRKGGNRLRITGQLVDATTGHHLWADRFEGALEDVFDLQDRVSSSVVGAIEPRLRLAEIERSRLKPTANLDAYDYMLHAYDRIQGITADGIDEAIALAAKAVALDPHFAQAQALGAWCYFWRIALGWSRDRAGDAAEGVRLAKTALAAVGDDPTVLACCAHVLGYLGGEYETAASLVDRALLLNPNSSLAHALSGWIRLFSSDTEAAVEQFRQALRLSPFDPFTAGSSKAGMAYAYLFRGDTAEAITWSRQAAEEFPNFIAGHLGLAAALALAGRVDEAAVVKAEILRLAPDFRAGEWQSQSHFKDRAFLDPLYTGLRKAGLPE
ncbi:MAG TPA: adenylate/guanylate cyclase domain-containing protein [Stellaceae bacterium]|nr:adenylate/guanylate cyclase domain-containing protein [Stellaceae bacterium]